MARKILITRSIKKADAFPYGDHRLKYFSGYTKQSQFHRQFYVHFNSINEQCTLFTTFG